MSDVELAFGQALGRARDGLGMNQTQFAARLQDAGLKNMHPTTISRMENGEMRVKFGDAVTIAAVLGYDSPMDMLTDDRAASALRLIRVQAAAFEIGMLADRLAQLREQLDSDSS